jgi:hypothetical protein
MTTDRLHLLSIRNTAETLTEAMHAGAFVTGADLCDLVSHVESMATEAGAIADPELCTIGMRIAGAMARIASAYIAFRPATA